MSEALCGSNPQAIRGFRVAHPGCDSNDSRCALQSSMFTFLSQCNKKCTSFHSLGGRGEPSPDGVPAPVGCGCCTSPIKLSPISWCRCGPGRTWRSPPAASRRLPTIRPIRNLTAAYELIARAGLTHTRPPFGIASVTVGNREVEVREEAVATTPFGTLLHFKKDIATRAAARAHGRAALRPFRHAFARDRAAPCCPSTTSSSPTGITPATCR